MYVALECAHTANMRSVLWYRAAFIFNAVDCNRSIRALIAKINQVTWLLGRILTTDEQTRRDGEVQELTSPELNNRSCP